MNQLKTVAVAAIAVFVLALNASAATAVSPLTSPSGSYYASTLKAEAEAAITFTGEFGAFGTISCKKSAFEGKIETTTVGKASGNLSSMSFAECTGGSPTAVAKPGSLEIEATSSGHGTVRSSGLEIIVHNTSVGTCVFKTSNTDIGTLTDSSVTGTNATIDVEGQVSSSEPNPFCGSTATWKGSYKVTTPNPLYVDY